MDDVTLGCEDVYFNKRNSGVGVGSRFLTF